MHDSNVKVEKLYIVLQANCSQPSPWLPRLKILLTPGIRCAIKERGQGYEITVKKKKKMPDGTIKTTVQGGRDLKKTQCYPKGFGQKVTRHHCAWLEPRMHDGEDSVCFHGGSERLF